MERQFTLRVVGFAEWILHRQTRLAVVSSTWPYEAPIIDTADPFRHGYGADALAFRFNRNGVLTAPPAYIAQAQANSFYKGRLGSFTRGRSTTRDVEALFGKGHSRAERPDGFTWYYTLPVYNPFEEWGGRR